MGRAFPMLCAKLEAARGTAIRSIHLQRAESVSAAQIVKVLIRCLKLIRAALTLALLYIYLRLVLSFFPWSRDYAPVLLGDFERRIVSAASAFGSYLPNLFVILVAILIAYGFARLSRFLFAQIETGAITWPGFYPEWSRPTYTIVRSLVLAFTATAILPYLPGANSPAFRGISIFLGVLFSLGSTSAVAKVVDGTILNYTRAFQIGDRVRIADTVGDAVEKTLLATRVQTIKNELVTVPSSLVLGSHITNFSSSQSSGH